MLLSVQLSMNNQSKEGAAPDYLSATDPNKRRGTLDHLGTSCPEVVEERLCPIT